MEYELEELLNVLSSIDISFINGMYHVETFEHSGRHKIYKGNDLPWLIHEIHFDFCD